MSKKSIILAVLLIAILSFSLIGCDAKYITAKEYVGFDKDKWELTFFDDFTSSDSLGTNWVYGYNEEGVRKGGYWVNDAVSFKDGRLIITTEYRTKESAERENKRYMGDGWYGGSIETSKFNYNPSNGDTVNDKFAGRYSPFTQRFGYFEIRCSVPESIGIWAAFWLMPEDNFKNDYSDSAKINSGEDGAEIDIFESQGAYLKEHRQDNELVTHAVHIDGYREDLKSVGSDSMYIKDLYNTMHTYALEWTPDKYVFYIDGYKTWEMKNIKMNVKDESNPLYGKQVECNPISQVPEYMIISNEVVGSNGVADANGWCGNPNLNDKSKKYDFIIDYVAVYQMTNYSL